MKLVTASRRRGPGVNAFASRYLRLSCARRFVVEPCFTLLSSNASTSVDLCRVSGFTPRADVGFAVGR
jgi:hypothetical protein